MRPTRHMVFFGDIRGTKSALESLNHGRSEVLEQRIEHLQNSFARCFLKFSDHSRSMMAMTMSDSVLAYWTDLMEAQRFALDFALELWRSLDKAVLSFRGFLDSGAHVIEWAALPQALETSSMRFRRIMPASVAIWSVTVAEASHFPEGIYVGKTISGSFEDAEYEQGIFQTGKFSFRRVII